MNLGSRWTCPDSSRTCTHTRQAVHVCPPQQQQRPCPSPAAGWLRKHIPVVQALGQDDQPPEGMEVPARQQPEPQPGHHHHSHDETDQQSFQQTLALVQQQSYGELQQLLEDEPQHRAFSVSFLFWLSAQEKKATGQQKQHLAQLAAQLVLLKEQAEYEASRRMLPPLASSLAYSNYSQWRTSNSSDLPEVTPGVTLTDLYKAAEREEAKLRQWQSPQKPSSTLDNFAAASGYSSFAADAMARVRARLAGFEDDATLQQQQQQGQQEERMQDPGIPAGDEQSQRHQQPQSNPAAERVLDELLMSCCCREERATLLPEAFMPPGLEVSATGSSSQSSAGGPVARVLTNPQRLLTAVAARQQHLQAATAAPEQQHQQQQVVLPSGEQALRALQELQEDIHEYDTHVYRKMSQRDLHGL